jgi:hypothetical protein
MAIDVTDPSDPFLLWEVTANSTRTTSEVSWGLNTAMSQVKIGTDLVDLTIAQTNNTFGTGGSGTVVKGIKTATGEVVWTFSQTYTDCRGSTPDTTNCPIHGAPTGNPLPPTTGFMMGPAMYDSGDTGVATNVLITTLYGELFMLDADTGTNSYGDVPLFQFQDDYHPVGATPSIFRSRTTGELLAVIVSGGYTDPVSATIWSPDTATQYAIGVPLTTPTSSAPLDEITVEGAGGFKIDLGVGNRAFAQAAVAGNELFIVTDSDDVNSQAFGLGGASGTLSRYSLSDTSSPALVDSTLAGGAGSVDVTADGTVYVGSGKSAKKIDISSDFDSDGGALYVGPPSGSTRKIWMRVR